MSVTGTLAANESRQVFRLGTRLCSVRDVIDAAFFRGEGQKAWEKLLRGLACETHAADQGLEVDQDAIDAAAQAFRYEFDLITAEETERWLADRGLTLTDFADYFARHRWAEPIGETAEPQQLAYSSAPPEMRELFIAELMLSGEFRRMANELSWRLAQASEEKTEPVPEAMERQLEELLERLAITRADLPHWVRELGRDDAWLREMLRLEAGYRAQREGLVTPQARQRELGSLRLQLTVFDLETMELDSRDAACEALFCVRNDGMSMEEVATQGRYPYRREQTLLEDIAPDSQQQFLSVSPGELLEPMESDGAFRLCRVLGKSDPDPHDPDVQQRIEQRIADRYFADLVGKHVHWDIALN